MTDALVLAHKSDGVLIVTDAGTTTRGAVAHTREQLEQVGADIISGVFNNFDTSRARYYPCYYRYYYSHRHLHEGGDDRPAANGKQRSTDSADVWQ